MHLDRTTPPGWKNTENHPHPCMGVTVTPSTLLSPLFPCSTPHWFDSLVAVSAWRQLHSHTLSLLGVAQGCTAQLQPGWLPWLAAFTLLAFRMLICSSYTVSLFFSRKPSLWYSTCQDTKGRSSEGQVQTQRDKVLKPLPAVRSSPEKPEKEKDQLEFKGHFLSKGVNLTEVKILTANTDCFLVTELLRVEEEGKKMQGSSVTLHVLLFTPQLFLS